MVEYEPGNPDNGEVYDLTALAAEMAKRGHSYRPHIGVDVHAERHYDNTEPHTEISFGGWGGGEYVSHVAHLEDVINMALPDGERVQSLRTKAKRLRKKAEDVDRDAMLAKLEQVAAVRHQHPIARVAINPEAIPQTT